MFGRLLDSRGGSGARRRRAARRPAGRPGRPGSRCRRRPWRSGSRCHRWPFTVMFSMLSPRDAAVEHVGVVVGHERVQVDQRATRPPEPSNAGVSPRHRRTGVGRPARGRTEAPRLSSPIVTAPAACQSLMISVSLSPRAWAGATDRSPRLITHSISFRPGGSTANVAARLEARRRLLDRHRLAAGIRAEDDDRVRARAGRRHGHRSCRHRKRRRP